MKMLFASGNAGKLNEVREVAKFYPGFEILSLADVKAARGLGDPPKVDETGRSYLENAVLKAEAYYAWCSLPCLADDSGLEVEALAGAPGLISARYAGEGVDFAANIEKLLKNMEGQTLRSARFRAVLFCRVNDGREFEAEGELTGRIGTQPSGHGGFGYDPIFIPDGFEKSLAELKGEDFPIKTHRTKALHLIFEEMSRATPK